MTNQNYVAYVLPASRYFVLKCCDKTSYKANGASMEVCLMFARENSLIFRKGKRIFVINASVES